MQSGGGDILARHIEGSLELRTDAGEIGLRDVRGPTRARTEKGSVYASFAAQPEGRLETRRGSVEVVFPGHAGVELDARSAHGTVEVPDLPRSAAPRNHFVGSLNGGGAALELYTARGNIRVAHR